MEEFGRLSEATPLPEECAALRGHENARRHLRQGETRKVAVAFAEDQPMIPATIVAAELQVSRNFDPLFLGAFILKVSAAANAQVSGRWWGGGHLGSISFLASAAIFNGVKINDVFPSHSGRGLLRGAGPAP